MAKNCSLEPEPVCLARESTVTEKHLPIETFTSLSFTLTLFLFLSLFFFLLLLLLFFEPSLCQGGNGIKTNTK